MESLRESHGVDTVLGALRILAIRCASRPESKKVADEIAATRDRLRERKDAWEDARDERMAATAEIAYRDAVLDAAVMTLSRQATAMVDGDTGDPRYRALFPSAPSERMRPVGGEAQAAFVKGVLGALRDDDSLEPLRSHEQPVKRALDDVTEATARRDDLQVAENRALNALQIALDEARETYNHAWHRLNVTFPKDKALVESFFRQLSSRSRERNAAPDGPAPAPARPSNPAPPQ